MDQDGEGTDLDELIEAQERVERGWDRGTVQALVADAVMAARLASAQVRKQMEEAPGDIAATELVGMIRGLTSSVEKLVKLLRELEDEIGEIERAGASEILGQLGADQLRQVMEWLEK